jgi:hypothetical protein
VLSLSQSYGDVHAVTDVTLPGAKQVYRRTAEPLADVITRRSEPRPTDYLPLLVPVMAGGRHLTRGDADDLPAAAERCADDLARLPEPARRIHWPVAPVTGPTHVPQ